MGRVIIGMDPHKRSATIEIIDTHEHILGAGRFPTDQAGYQQMLAVAREHPDRVWAIEGCAGIGRHLAQRLVADGETVWDVPAKLSAQVCASLSTGIRTAPRLRARAANRRAITCLWTPSRTSADFAFESAYYFHGTRVFDPATFSAEGILPLGRAVDRLWTSLYTLVADTVTDADWRRLRANLESGAEATTATCTG